MIKAVVLVVMCIGLVGCDVVPKDVGSHEFDPNKVSYFKDYRTNLCYGVISYTRTDASGRQAAGLSFTEVPCSNVENLLRK